MVEKQQIITIVGTEGEEAGEYDCSELGDVRIYTREELVERIRNLTKEGYGYSILTSSKRV